MPQARPEAKVIPKLDGEGALYLQIERAVRSAILSRQWSPGSRIPSEFDFVAAYDTTRSTVAKALSTLVRDGLLERRRKQGTRVVGTTETHPVIGILDPREDVRTSGKRYSYLILSREELKPSSSSLPEWPDVGAKTPLLVLNALHCGDGRPIVFERRVISLKAAPEARKAEFREEPPNTWLLARLPCTRIRHTIKAVAADKLRAQGLEIKVGAPLLVSERRTWADKLPVTWVELSYPGSSNEFTGEFNPLNP